MAVEILERDMRVSLADLTGSDIAYDVHVRRVFLRTGMVDRDEVGHMVDAARSLTRSVRGSSTILPGTSAGAGSGPGCPIVQAAPCCERAHRFIERGRHVRRA